jgi:hypothetical protein
MGRKNEKNTNRKEEFKLSIFADDMILFLKYAKSSRQHKQLK